MRKLFVLLVAALACVSVGSLASAQEFSEDFESYTSGSALHGQNGWKGWTNSSAAGAPVSSKYAYSGKNSVEIVSTSDLVHEFTANGGLWEFSAMQYIPSGTTGEPYFILLNEYDDAGNDYCDWSVQWHYNASSGTFTTESEGNDVVTSIVFGQWVPIRFVIDLDNNICEYYYNGELIETTTWDSDGHTTLQAVDLYGNSASSIYYDDIELSKLSTDPKPADGDTEAAVDGQLSWTSPGSSSTYNVYFGTSYEDVLTATTTNPLGVLVGEDVSGAMFDAGQLEYGQTYYWRVDEIGGTASGGTVTGLVWSFTVEPALHTIASANVTATASSMFAENMGPEKTADGSGMDDDDQHSTASYDMWLSLPTDTQPWIQYAFDTVYKLEQMLVWNSNQSLELAIGFGVKAVTIETSLDGETWTALGDFEFAQATGQDTYTANTTVDFAGTLAKSVRLMPTKSWGGLTGPLGLSEVRFLYTPVVPRLPDPADGETEVGVDVALSWRAGREAVSHQVFFGTDEQAVADGTAPMTTVTDSSYTPDDVVFANVYYWKVIEVNEAGSKPEWESPVWTFTTEEYGAIEDFESYDDTDNFVFDTWLDGYVDKSSGSQVGYGESANGTFNETSIVNSGSQSMPLTYNNSASPYYSETSRSWSTAQDWTTNDADTLKLFFYGSTTNSAEPLYVGIEDSSGNKLFVIHSDTTAIQSAQWQAWSIPMSTFTDAGVKMNKVKTMYMGVGKRTSPTSGGAGIVYIDDVRRGTSLARHVKSDVTAPGDTVLGVPNDGITTGNDYGWPSAEYPALAFDDSASTKFLHFKGEIQSTGVQVTPSVGATIVTELTFTTANDSEARDPVSFEFYGSNTSIDGPYTLIASGDIVDFAQATAWARYTKNTTPITFENNVAYTHYQVLFPTVRDAANANSMQIAEIELIGVAE